MATDVVTQGVTPTTVNSGLPPKPTLDQGDSSSFSQTVQQLIEQTP